MRSAFVAIALLTCMVTRSLAQTEVSPIALVGRWKSSAVHSSGASVIVNVTLGRNMKFHGTATVNDKPAMEYAGTWEVSGTTLVWRYENDTADMAAIGKVDTDEIVSVDSDKLVLRSSLSGKLREYLRAK